MTANSPVDASDHIYIHRIPRKRRTAGNGVFCLFCSGSWPVSFFSCSCSGSGAYANSQRPGGGPAAGREGRGAHGSVGNVPRREERCRTCSPRRVHFTEAAKTYASKRLAERGSLAVPGSASAWEVYRSPRNKKRYKRMYVFKKKSVDDLAIHK